MPLPFWEPLCLFTLEGGGMLQCHPESGYCCFSASSDLPQGSKGRRKRGCSIPVFPLWLPILSLSAVHTGTQTLLSLKGFLSLYMSFQDPLLLFLSVASPALGLGERKGASRSSESY